MRVKDLVHQVLEANKNSISELRVRKKLNEYAKRNDIHQLYENVHSDYEPVFVLSTGRCGTSFLTHMIQLSDEIMAFHEPHPEFFYHSAMAYSKYKSQPEIVSAIFDSCRYEMIRNCYIADKVYLETNNRITFFAHQIACLYPKSKFIHLVRNPVSFVKSGIGRNWYSGNTLYDEGRIVSAESDWRDWKQEKKIAWLWNETNSFIEDFKLTLEDSRKLTIKAEELFSSSLIQESVFSFANVKLPSRSSLKRRVSKKINEGVKHRFSDSDLLAIREAVATCKLQTKYGY